MNKLTLEWQEADRTRTEIIHDQQPSKNPGTIRLGRDPARCDLVFSDPTVSGLHIELIYHPQQRSFALRNLRISNPPVVDGQQIVQGEALLSQGSTIYLGQVLVTVTAVSLATNAIPATILIPPPVFATAISPIPAAVSYGLECPHCRRISPYERMKLGCQWCGTSLAAAVSVLVTPT